MKRLSALPNRRFLRQPRLSAVAAALVLAGIGVAPPTALAATVTNPICPTEFALFNPDNGGAIVVPPGFKVSVFKAGLNFPTGIAFKGNSQSFEVYVLESGHGLPSICNEQGSPKVGADRWLTGRGAFGRHRVRTWPSRRTALRVGLQSGDPRRWAKQQLTHRDRGPGDGQRHPVYHGAADR